MAKKSRSSTTVGGGADDATARLPPSGMNKPKAEAQLSEDQPTAMIDLAALAESEFGGSLGEAADEATRAMDAIAPLAAAADDATRAMDAVPAPTAAPAFKSTDDSATQVISSMADSGADDDGPTLRVPRGSGPAPSAGAAAPKAPGAAAVVVKHNAKPADKLPPTAPVVHKSDELTTGRLGLDVRMQWREDTHSARFYAESATVTLGQNGTFPLPPDVMGKTKDTDLTVLIQPDAQHKFALRIDNPSMTGHLLVDGQAKEIAKLRAAGGNLVVPMTDKTHAVVQFGEFTFILSRALIPKRPPISLWSKENWVFLLAFLLSVAILGIPLGLGMSAWGHRERAKIKLAEEAMELERQVVFVEDVQKEEEKKPEKEPEKKPEEIKIEPPKEEKKPEEAVKQEQKAIEDKLKDLSAEERKDKEKEIVKEKIADATKDIDAQLNKALDMPATKLFAEDDAAAGNPNGNQYQADPTGELGKNLAGDPSGKNRDQLDGDATKKQIAGDLQKDKNSADKKVDIEGSVKKQNVVRVGGSVGDTDGELPKPVIRAYIATKMGGIKACYQRQLQSNPELAGKVKVAFLISPNGSVTGVRKDSTTLNNDAVEDCVISLIKSWKFPPAKGGGSTKVEYPFVFSSH